MTRDETVAMDLSIVEIALLALHTYEEPITRYEWAAHTLERRGLLESGPLMRTTRHERRRRTEQGERVALLLRKWGVWPRGAK